MGLSGDTGSEHDATGSVMASAAPSEVYAASDAYVSQYAALDPTGATAVGIDDHPTALTDYSPEALEERSNLAKSALLALKGIETTETRDRIASAFMQERLSVGLSLESLGEQYRDLNVLGGPIQATREVFDLMPRENEADWDQISVRMSGVAASLASVRSTLESGIQRGLLAPSRQVEGVARQCAAWAGTTGMLPFFISVASEFDRSGIESSALKASLKENAERATQAYAEIAEFLSEKYLPASTPVDGVGRERYAAFSRLYNGAELDLDEAYEWGWAELERIEEQMTILAERILPGAALSEVVDLLETDPSRSIEGPDAFRGWLQDLLDQTISDLNETHFDIPERVQRVEAMIAPPGGGAAMYYTGPSEDFSRPGRTWYPTQGHTRFPLWGEVSTCYHEGVPGHHLQIAQVVHLGERLTRFQRTLGWNSGHGEGWALYAERLMGELGYLEVPDYEFGMLRAHALRAVRVIVDIGMHLGLRIPSTEKEFAGEVWTPEIGLAFAIERSRFPSEMMSFEIDRYLGLPGQAISYKIGERVWLEAREASKKQHGAEFDLKAWHAFALDLGPLGLDLLKQELAEFRPSP